MYYVVPAGFILLSVALWPSPAFGFELPKFVAASALALLCAFSLLFSRHDSIGLSLSTRAGKAFLVFAAVTVLSPLWSVAPVVSVLGAAPRFQGVLMHLSFFTFVFFCAACVKKGEGRALVTGIVAANVLVVFYGLLQMLAFDPLEGYWMSDAFLGRVFSTIGHPNMLGQFILLTVPFVGLRWIGSRDHAAKMVWTGQIAINGALLFATASRSALLGVIPIVLLFIPELRAFVRSRGAAVSIGRGFVLSLIVVLCVSVGFLFFAERFSGTFEAGRSFGAREVIWEGTFQMIVERPWGWGLGTMAFTSPRFIGRDIYAFESLTTVIDRAHNEPLHILLTLGPIGFLAYLWLLGFLFAAAYLFWHRDGTGLMRACVVGTLAYLTSVFFGFSSIATGALFWVLIGILLGSLPVNESRSAPRVSALVHVLLIAASTVSLVTALRWAQARSALAESPIQSVLTFGFDRESLIQAAEVSLRTLESGAEHTEKIAGVVRSLIADLTSLTGGYDGMADVLTAWLAAIEGDRAAMDRALLDAEEKLPESVVFRRAAMHIAELLGDTALRDLHRTALRELLPADYAVEGTELRRILFKQHPWLRSL